MMNKNRSKFLCIFVSLAGSIKIVDSVPSSTFNSSNEILWNANSLKEACSSGIVSTRICDPDKSLHDPFNPDHVFEVKGAKAGDNDNYIVSGEAVVRVEKAMDNSRRIFAGVDILASVDDVWKVLTDYDNLQKVVPNLAVNEVVERYEGDTNGEINYESDSSLSSEEQIKVLSKQMRGSQLKQIGKAKVVGINFSAQVTLEVREWPNGIPDFFHFNDDVYEGYSRTERAKLESKRRLERYHFPRPFAISKLPTKDISMQSIENDDGEFRLYQGVWRMQPLPGCAPEGGAAMRLTYAVEISPRPYLPVALVENRISKDLCNNLLAIREFVTK